MTDRIVIAHADCADGFCAAWVAHTVYGDSAEYVFAKYGDPPPGVEGRDVLIVDFSYPRAVLLELAAKARSIRVLDHHASAQRDLEGLDFCTFDMNESGATLAWKALHPDTVPPRLCLYVRDRDLWKWALGGSKAVSAWIGVQERTFAAWDELRIDLAQFMPDVIERGEAILKHIDAYVESTAKNARLYVLDGHTVPFVNAPGMMGSELVGKLAEKAPFAVGFFQRADGKWQYSLRSRGDYDVSKLAERFGGGGHARAAGFEHVHPPADVFFEAKGETPNADK